ncbi:recombinase family protein [Allobranchiibius sp. GilTou38]|uniref:recombinase family protein n=1 Tax=Allobranchiibius sp. GilTou38 TaxID=2815210 RepID=UPI001AA122B3|nr:recombinase family protein [Allobranchiibius sp. GilTou38]
MIYARLSRDRKGTSEGVDRQIAACRDLCASNGWEVADTYVDNDISATTGRRRPEFERLLTDGPTRIVVWHTDRLVRLTRELERVIQLGVPVNAVTAGHLDLSTPAGRATAMTVTAWAQYEGEQKTLRQELQSDQRADAGMPKWVYRPFGYNRDLSIREEEAALLRAAYESVIAGIGVFKIARSWNDQGVLTSQGRAWSGQRLAEVLKSPRNAGILVHLGEEHGSGKWEPIVREATFRAVADILSRPERRAGGVSRRSRLLTGVATCAKCESNVKGSSRARTGPFKGEATYSCVNGCFSLPEPWVDRLVLAAMPAVLADHQRHWSTFTGQDTDNSAALITERAQLAERLEALADDYADGAITREQMHRGTERVRARLDELDAELATVGEAASFAHQLADEEYVWQVLTERGNDEARALIGAVCTITLHPRGKGQKGLRDDLVDIKVKGTGKRPRR